MPTYEYECESCGRHFTEMMSISEHDQRRVRCSQCNGETHDVIKPVYVNAPRKS
jgi:putative FmdB family regulatory protein